MEWRFAEGNVGRLSTNAEELVRLKVELITTVSSNSATTAAKRATRTIPIVMHLAEAPVEQGLIESLARPSGNVTGTTGIGPEAVGKVIQILKEAQPNTARVAVLRGGTGPGDLYSVSRERAAGAFGITFQYFDVTRPEEVSVALYRIASSNPDALYVTGGPVLRARFGDIVAFALERKLITFTNSFSFVNAGGFLAYVTDLPDMWDLTARYVDSILKGARPADLPVEQPRKFLLIVNAKTARAIGFKIPQSLLLRADRVIE